MSEPTQTVLTPAQVEVLEEMLEDRKADVIAFVNESIAMAIDDLRAEMTAQIDALREQVATDMANAVMYGERIGLRAANAHTLGAVQSDFADDVQSIRWEWRTEIGDWESFTVERSHA